MPAVVTDRPQVVRSQPAVARAVTPLDACAVVGVVGVSVRAALEVGREREGLMCNAVGVDVREACLLAVCAGQPAQHVVERPVLHHDHDDVVDSGARRLRQPRLRGECCAGKRLRPDRGRRGGAEERPARERLLPDGHPGESIAERYSLAMARNDLLGRLADISEEAMQRLSDAPGGERLMNTLNSMRDRVDELQRRVRGLEDLEKRLEALEARVDKIAKGDPSASSTGSSKTTSTKSSGASSAKKP